MISAASELLAAFIASESRKLDGFEMPHMPTLGKAYEAITKAGIDQRFVLPPGLDLRVVSGFIEGSPNQYDCMLVLGDGDRYGLTEEYRYRIDQVLCVIEVKKRLTRSDYADAINHLADVHKCFMESFIQLHGKEKFASILDSVRAFERITGRIGPNSFDALDAMPLQDRTLIGLLVRQKYTPVTVLFAFEGYQTESGLRRALLEIMEGEVGQPSNTSIDLLPSLVTSGDFSIVKCNAQPYMLRQDEGGWIAAASTRHNSALILLELLWTKISSFCNVKMPFGENSETETLRELFSLQALPNGDAIGWRVDSFEYSEKQLKRPKTVSWQPDKLSGAAMSLVRQLAFHGGFFKLNAELALYVQKEYKVTIEMALREVVCTSAFASSPNSLQATSAATYLALLDDGSGYVAVDRGKLEWWCEKNGVQPTFMTIISL